MQIQSLGREDPLEKEMATHSSVLAWRIPWTEEPSGLQSTGSQRVRHGLETKPIPHLWPSLEEHGASLVAQMVKSLPTMRETQVQFLGQENPLEKGMATHPGLLPGESHGRRSLVSHRPLSCKEVDTTT